MAFLKTILYVPIYNTLIFLIAVVPGNNLGLAIILLTIIVRAILFPLGQKAAQSQIALNKVEPEINKIKEEYKGNKEEQAKKTFELYKKYNIKPFSGCLMALIQLPIIIALYYVFLKGLNFDQNILYSFIKQPDVINVQFLGLFNLAEKSIILAIVAGISQYIQGMLMSKKNTKEPISNKARSFADSFKQSMNIQMKYFLPLIIFYAAYQTSGALALYWTISSMFTIAQEAIARRNMTKDTLTPLTEVKT